MAGIDRFMREYEVQLTTAVAEHPQDYPWFTEDTVVHGNVRSVTFPKQTVDKVVAKMRLAFENDSYSLDGRAVRATCKALGIKCTRKAINAYVKDQTNS